MTGGARPGAGRKREKPLTLTEIGQRMRSALDTSSLSTMIEVRGRYLMLNYIFRPGIIQRRSFTKAQALAYLNRLERKGAA
jgi:hypothetical protein